MKIDSVSRANYNSPSFGIRKCDPRKYKRFFKNLEPDLKETLNDAVDKLCKDTNKAKIRGIFIPISVENDRFFNVRILKYMIKGLHVNGKPKINELQINNLNNKYRPIADKYSTVSSTVVLFDTRDSNDIYIGLLKRVLQEFNIHIGETSVPNKKSSQRYINKPRARRN